MRKMILEMRKMILAAVITLLSFNNCFSQESEWLMKASLLKESFFYPSGINFTAPMHPGFAIGIEKQTFISDKWTKHLTVDVGFYHHKYFQNGLFLLGGYGWGYKPISKLQVTGSVALGYLHIFRPTEVYELHNGSYVKANNLGKPNAMLGIDVGLIYAIDPAEKYLIAIDYKPLVNGPFNIAYGSSYCSAHSSANGC